jgi:hypothetical protein
MRRTRLRLAAAATTLALLAVASPAHAATGWTTNGYNHADALTQSQGLATGTLRAIVMSPGICVVLDSKSWRLRQS